MIDFIEGTIAYIEADCIILNAGGIGYRIFSGNPYSYREEQQQKVRVYTHHYVREDAIYLYGFSNREERDLFRKLLDVSGIGPKGALAITSAGTPGQIISAIELENINFLTRFPGIGKKTAQRIILDLKDKVKELAHIKKTVRVVEGLPNDEEMSLFHAFEEPKKEAEEALRALGYSDAEVQKVMNKLEAEGADLASTDKIIKRALQLFLTT
ncbi:Holliday junction branch migration protein RuvA [Aneurinibacillus sp. Ricciae_BoGa-3]|uniref:Holliday junction branch migration protein RuvA n=1 Tax=Aneurinibacillus sp. Ricciae_BoGa-3 TaxID=3022697 RepID=UPI002340FD6F|nr:Holliday junction branch migration protein RuvA [Aneurinibacillus sp. Ricciae_BoGa-3]WCK53622.1 Holliday junction branch migration protein RuvA [Aneurinibacillus sp. Ricciae_BoGa-3]